MIQTGPQNSAPQPSRALGILFVIIGASSYGLLATIIKLAYAHGSTTAEITMIQFGLGAIVLSGINLLSGKAGRIGGRDARKLLLAGIPGGILSVAYYYSIKYISASVAVVLLMQSVWMGVVAEAIFKRQLPSLEKLAAIALIMVGTVLATGALPYRAGALDPRGVALGLFAGLCFTATMFASGSVAVHLSPEKRSQYMILGSTASVLVLGALTQLLPYYGGVDLLGPSFSQAKPFEFSVLFPYGVAAALFGTILPPVMFNKGFPAVGIGMGSILSSMELPFAMLTAYLVLGDSITPLQLLGAATIFAAILVLNYRSAFGKKLGEV